MQIKNNYPLSNVTTLEIGGPAKKFVEVSTQEELKEVIKYAKNENMNYLVIGGGSNLLVSDKGVNCLIIKNNISEIKKNNNKIIVKSGTPLQELVDYSIENSFSGLQKLTKIPGTLGGAIYGNAGAYGQAIADHITEVATYDGRGIITLSKDECQFNYRDSVFKKNKYIILSAKFQLEKGDPEALKMEVKEVIWKRFVKYPPGIKSPGSFFKNIIASTLPQEILDKIPADKIVFGKLPAGTLLEEVGAKGQKLDGIEIAPYHANLFMNTEQGTAKAFYDLAKMYAEKVKEKFGITLVPEVQLINLPPI